MTSTIITEGQSLVDVAIQELGTVAALFDLADAAELGITDLLTPGQVLAVPETALLNSDLVAYFRKLSKRINTGVYNLPAIAIGAHDFDFLDFDGFDFDTGAAATTQAASPVPPPIAAPTTPAEGIIHFTATAS